MKKVILLALLHTFLLVSCDSDNEDTTTQQPGAGITNEQIGESTNNTPEVSSVNSIRLADNSTFGKILTDAEGRSLYFFSKDTKKASECNGGCLAAWPAFYNKDLTLDEGLSTDDFGVITREDGSKQNTYKGWPLYYFASDEKAGDTKGDGVTNNWFIAKPDYSLMYAQAKLTGDDLEFYITSATGRTIYAFANDNKNDNNFTKSDFTNNSVWPIVEITVDKVPSILNVTDFGTIDVFGRTQLTYKGHPLYYFGNDTERGDAKGVSGIWPTVNTDTTAALDALDALEL